MRFATQRLCYELSSFFKLIISEIDFAIRRAFLSQTGQNRTRFKPLYLFFILYKKQSNLLIKENHESILKKKDELDKKRERKVLDIHKDAG